jgi:hypothetical protein
MQFDRENYVLADAVNRFFGTVAGHPAVEVKSFDGSSTRLAPEEGSINIFDEMGKLGLMICGGAITSIFTSSKINDLDFYMLDPEKRIECMEFLIKFFGLPCLTSLNAYTFKRKSKKSNRVYTVQLITRFAGTPQEIFDWFDFTVTHAAYRFDENDFVFGDRYFADLARRELVYSGASKYPICAMYRTKKYQERGFNLSGATIMHIALCIVQLKIETYSQLKEQLMGIDTMFLQGLLNAKDPDAPVEYGEFLEEAFKRLNYSTGQTMAEGEDHGV